MTNTYNLIFGSLGILGIFNGLRNILLQLQPQLNVTYYPLELSGSTVKAIFFLLFGIIATTIVIHHEIQEREMQRQN